MPKKYNVSAQPAVNQKRGGASSKGTEADYLTGKKTISVSKENAVDQQPRGTTYPSGVDGTKNEPQYHNSKPKKLYPM